MPGALALHDEALLLQLQQQPAGSVEKIIDDAERDDVEVVQDDLKAQINDGEAESDALQQATTAATKADQELQAAGKLDTDPVSQRDLTDAKRDEDNALKESKDALKKIGDMSKATSPVQKNDLANGAQVDEAKAAGAVADAEEKEEEAKKELSQDSQSSGSAPLPS